MQWRGRGVGPRNSEVVEKTKSSLYSIHGLIFQPGFSFFSERCISTLPSGHWSPSSGASPWCTGPRKRHQRWVHLPSPILHNAGGVFSFYTYPGAPPLNDEKLYPMIDLTVYRPCAKLMIISQCAANISFVSVTLNVGDRHCILPALRLESGRLAV